MLGLDRTSVHISTYMCHSVPGYICDDGAYVLNMKCPHRLMGLKVFIPSCWHCRGRLQNPLDVGVLLKSTSLGVDLEVYSLAPLAFLLPGTLSQGELT